MLNGPFRARSASLVTRVPAAVESNLLLARYHVGVRAEECDRARMRVLDDPIDERRLSTSELGNRRELRSLADRRAVQRSASTTPVSHSLVIEKSPGV